MRPVIYPYQLSSHSSRVLAQALNTIRVREVGRYRPRRDDLIINWGNPRVPGWWNRAARDNVINHPEAVRNAINKVNAFNLFRAAGVSTPNFAVDIRQARELFTSENTRVLCRVQTQAHSGRGIVIASSPEELVRAPLYVKYVPKKYEYRIHVFNGEIIDVEQKKRRNNAEQGPNEKLIRSHRNGWVFTRNEIRNPSDRVRRTAVDAVHALGLSFGAVDIGSHPRYGVKVYEVNTAPGIEGTTLETYTRVIRDLVT